MNFVRIVRGSGWNLLPLHVWVAFRSRDPTDNRSGDLGFRIARSER